MTALVDIFPAGDHAVLVQLAPDIPAAELHARAEAVRALDGVLACVVGQASLYVIFSEKPAFDSQPPPREDARRATEHRIAVAFDGGDLGEFLARTRQTRDEFLRRVRGLRLTVRYLGFRGGFAYLDGWPAEWAMPRRPTSRPVKRGSFAIAGSVAGFYPIDSPGGWNILGHTSEDLEYRFAPGDEIVLGLGPRASGLGFAKERRSSDRSMKFSALFMTKIAPPNWKNLEHGKPVGGPFDPELASCVEGDVYEFAQVGPKITEGEFAWADLNGVRTVRGPVDIGRITDGLRGYLANRKSENCELRTANRLVVKTMRGPHDIGIDELKCIVTPKLDRIGIRVQPQSKLDAPADMPSCGMQFGTLQLHPDGSIVAMGPEHPVTGGYLQPMTVLWSERWKLAHLTPGERVRFVAER